MPATVTIVESRIMATSSGNGLKRGFDHRRELERISVPDYASSARTGIVRLFSSERCAC